MVKHFTDTDARNHVQYNKYVKNHNVSTRHVTREILLDIVGVYVCVCVCVCVCARLKRRRRTNMYSTQIL